jgi:hypothetical protein
MPRDRQEIGQCTRCKRGTVNCSHNLLGMGHRRFTPGNIVVLIAVIARRQDFDQTKKNRTRLATQRFARSVVGKRLDETDIPSDERSGPVQLCPATR